MSDKPPNVIGYAVQSCLQKCALTDLPMTCLHDYECELKAAGWNDESIAAFRRLVLESLGALSHPPEPEPRLPNAADVAE